MDSIQYNIDFSLSKEEEWILKLWKSEKVYHHLLIRLKDGKIFYFMDGPPFPNSDNLHFGHILVGSLKSIVLNYYQMNGYNVLNKIGYDTHGLPIEMVANNELNVHTPKEVYDLGIGVYNDVCKKLIDKYTGSWQGIYDRTARFVKPDDQYRTMDINFMESVWWVFKELWKKGLVYYGCKIMPYSTQCCTPLSNFEAGSNHKEVLDKTVYVKFPVTFKDELTNLVAWTTTPWTLVANLVLCVNPELTYVKVKDAEYTHIMAKNTLGNLYKKKDKFTILDEFLGSELVGLKYEPLFGYYSEPELFQVISDKFVDSKAGTGIVHIAPGFGEIDLEVCLKNGIIQMDDVLHYCPVDDSGNYVEPISDYIEQFCLDCNEPIIRGLKESGKVLKIEMYKHSYPMCPRKDTPLIYKAVDSFFIEVTKLKDRMIHLNKSINWVPASVGLKRFNDWLENTRDWCVSRNRVFGTPIPVWISKDGDSLCIGSIDELMELSNLKERPTDLHREFIDNIVIVKDGKEYYRTSFIFDCWFESGAVPYGQLHYPFENAGCFDDRPYLADFICEGIDQTRGWFYTLLVLSTALFDKAPFNNVICSGLILDNSGHKFSKRLGNFVPPGDVINKYGSDSLRLYLVGSPAATGGSFKFVDEDISEIHRKLYQLINCMKFFLEHAIKFHKDGYDLDLHSHSENIMDNWILSRTAELINIINDQMKQFLVSSVIPHIYTYIEDLANWYIKLNRNRLKRRYCDEHEQNNALATLYKVFLIFSQAVAPFMPFLAESFYQRLKQIEHQPWVSVHHCPYPTTDTLPDDLVIRKRMRDFQRTAVLIRTLRSGKLGFQSVRVPIKKVTVYCTNDSVLSSLKELEEYLVDDANLLNIEYNSNLTNLLSYGIEPRNRELGKEFRNKAKDIKAKMKDLVFDKPPGELIILDNIISSEYYDIIPIISYTPKDNELFLHNDDIMVVVDFTYDNTVKEVHSIRMFTRVVQDMRKRTNLRPWNKIKIYYKTDDEFLKNTIAKYYDKLIADLLYPSINLETICNDSDNIIISEEHEIIDTNLLITIVKDE